MLKLSFLDTHKQPYTKYLKAFSFIPLLGVTKFKKGYKN